LGQPVALFEDRYLRSGRPWTSYDISGDGERFLMMQTRGHGVPQEISVILNWFDEVERLVPTDG
jgi:hypothetical protein